MKKQTEISYLLVVYGNKVFLAHFVITKNNNPMVIVAEHGKILDEFFLSTAGKSGEEFSSFQTNVLFSSE